MADTTLDKIEIFAPELVSVDDAVKEMILDDVKLEVSDKVFGNFEEKAQRLLCCHYLTLYNNSGKNTTGGVNNKSVGGVSVGFDSGTYTDKNRLDETSYGRQFNELRRKVVWGFRVISHD
jgi:hypothetical protein